MGGACEGDPPRNRPVRFVLTKISSRRSCLIPNFGVPRNDTWLLPDRAHCLADGIRQNGCLMARSPAGLGEGGSCRG